MLNPAKIWHEQHTDLSTSPVKRRATLPWEIKKFTFQHYYSYTSDYLPYVNIRRKQLLYWTFFSDTVYWCCSNCVFCMTYDRLTTRQRHVPHSHDLFIINSQYDDRVGDSQFQREQPEESCGMQSAVVALTWTCESLRQDWGVLYPFKQRGCSLSEISLTWCTPYCPVPSVLRHCWLGVRKSLQQQQNNDRLTAFDPGQPR